MQKSIGRTDGRRGRKGPGHFINWKPFCSTGKWIGREYAPQLMELKLPITLATDSYLTVTSACLTSSRSHFLLYCSNLIPKTTRKACICRIEAETMTRTPKGVKFGFSTNCWTVLHLSDKSNVRCQLLSAKLSLINIIPNGVHDLTNNIQWFLVKIHTRWTTNFCTCSCF